MLRLGLVLERPHVVEAVGELDKNDPDVVGHGQQHLAEVLGLTLLFGLEVNLSDLGDAVDQVCHLDAEHPLQFLPGGEGILDGVMEQPGHHRWHVELQVSQYARHLHGVNEIGLSRETRLSLVDLGAVDIGLADQVQVGHRIVGDDLIEDIVEPYHGEKDKKRAEAWCFCPGEIL